MPQLPVGQHEVKNWPVLDLGEQPEIALDSWKLEVGGLVENPFTLTWEQFLALPQADDVSDFHCVTTWSRYDNHWRGVRFTTIAELAVPKPDAKFVLCTGYDFMPGSYIPYTVEPAAGARDRRRRAARAHVGGQAAAARTRRSVPDDHAEAVRVEGREMDPQDRVSRGGQARASGKSAATRTPRSPGSTTVIRRADPRDTQLRPALSRVRSVLLRASRRHQRPHKLSLAVARKMKPSIRHA